MKIKYLNEIVDGNDDLIGADDIPTNGSDLESQANNTTDYNAKVGQQPFRYDMLGRFGFTLLPFMEGEDKNEGQAELENDLVDLLNQRYVDILSHYFRNPQKIKPDYRKHVTDDEISDETMKHSVICADKILKAIEKHFEKSLKNLDEQFKENLAEAVMFEDKMVDKKNDEFTKKGEDGEVQDAKLKKIAGLINKLDADKKKKIINLLETD